ncbi:MAG: T9SS type A sorting domain-containing protein [Bacteroidota bacterium]
MKRFKNLAFIPVLTLLMVMISMDLQAQFELDEQAYGEGADLMVLPKFSISIINSWECQEEYHVTYVDFNLDMNVSGSSLPDVIECALKFNLWSAGAMSVAYDEYTSFNGQLYSVVGSVCPEENADVCFTLNKYISEESVTVMLTSSVPPGGNGSGGGNGYCNQLNIIEGSMIVGNTPITANYYGSGVDCVFGFPLDCEPEEAPDPDPLKKGEQSNKPIAIYGPAHLSIFPNPADGEIVINTDLAFPLTVEIFTINGRPLGTWETERVDTSQLPTGLYVVKVSGGGQSYVRKIAVNH